MRHEEAIAAAAAADAKSRAAGTNHVAADPLRRLLDRDRLGSRARASVTGAFIVLLIIVSAAVGEIIAMAVVEFVDASPLWISRVALACGLTTLAAVIFVAPK